MWCFLVFGAPAFALMPLLVALIVGGDIQEEKLAALCTILSVVPIIVVTIVVRCCFKKNVSKVSFSLTNMYYCLRKHTRSS